MALSPAISEAQRLALKSFILADPTLSVLAAGFQYNDLANALNADSTFWCWKTVLGKHDVTDQTSVDPLDGTTTRTFNWSGTGGFIQRSQGERDAWIQIWNTSNSCNPNLANVRACFDDIFSGSGAGAQNNRAHITALSKRKATVAEKVLATGTGTAASPGAFVAQGTVRAQEMAALLA